MKRTCVDTLLMAAYGSVELINAVPRVCEPFLGVIGTMVRQLVQQSCSSATFRDLKCDVVLGDVIAWRPDPSGTFPSGGGRTLGAEFLFLEQESGLGSQLGLHCSSRIVARP